MDCNLLLPGLHLPIPKKPFVVKLLMERIGGGYDDLLPVSERPIFLMEDEVDLAAGLLRGTAKNRLPVVYVSVDRRGGRSINVEKLAKWLSGMAHVIVEPSTHFGFALSRHVSSANAYGGAVSIYWPDGVAQQARFLPPRFESAAVMEREIEDVVRVALTHIRPRPEGTWSYLRETISRSRIEALRAAGSTEVEAYMREFDDELESKQRRLDEAEGEIRRLMGENRRFEASAGRGASGIISRGSERELYPGEVTDAVLKTLASGRNSLVPDSRWMHLVDDVLRANAPTQTGDQICAEIKAGLSLMQTFGHAERKLLEAVGFVVTDGGKHVKAVYHGDDRYVFTISKTSSDHRAGKNLVSIINRKITG